MRPRFFVVFAAWNNGFEPAHDITIDVLGIVAYFKDATIDATTLCMDQGAGTFQVRESLDMVKLKIETAYGFVNGKFLVPRRPPAR